MRYPLALALALVASAAPAASFDCARTPSPDEKAVCASRLLNDRDVHMATLYALDLRFVPMGGRDRLRDEQREFLKARKRCGGARTCIARIYDKRIAVLQAIIDRRVVTRGPF